MRRGPKALHLNSESEADAGLTKGNQARGEKQTADRTAIANIVANRRPPRGLCTASNRIPNNAELRHPATHRPRSESNAMCTPGRVRDGHLHITAKGA